MPQSKTVPREALSKTTISDAPSAWPKWMVEVTNWSLATIAFIGIGMAIVTQFLPFHLALQTVLTGVACGAFVTFVKYLVRYFVDRRKLRKGEEGESLEISHLSKKTGRA